MANDTGLSLSDPARDLEIVANHIREGRFQRSLALLTAATSVVSGLEVAYEHYRGSYSRRVMYTPVILSALLAMAGVAGFFSRRAARTVLRLASFVTLVDALTGSYFHVRGIKRKPGGWRLPMTNMIMGPPIFAPLLFGTSAYLGLIVSYLQREESTAPASTSGKDAFLSRLLPSGRERELLSEEQDVLEGKFQRQVAIATGISALLSGFEALLAELRIGRVLCLTRRQSGQRSLETVSRRASISVTRRYRPHTLILETTTQSATGSVIITDFMPIRGKHSDLIRIVHCIEGSVEMDLTLCPRFHYGSTIPWMDCDGPSREQPAWVAKAGPDLVVLRSPIPVKESSPGTLTAEFTLSAGATRIFSLTYGSSFEPVPDPIDVREELQNTERFWIDWAAKNKYEGPYRDAVERSLISLKAMTYRPSGGIVAAPTTSLPERIGGPLNWDYRYCWLRDATLTLSALLEAGYTEEVIAWKQWLLRAVGLDAAQVQIMYGIAGERHIADWEVPWLSGYEGSTPVRIGNAAQSQMQQDIYGEIAAALYHARDAGVPCNPRELQLQQALTEHLVKIWDEPGSGMWEERDKPQHFTYSGVMSWLALERAVKSIEQHGMNGDLAGWKKLRDTVRQQVEEKGFNPHVNSFVQHYGSKDLDASVLLLPVVGFLPADDPRVLATVNAIETELLKDGLVLRNIPKSSKGRQGAFLACSFWLVEVYAMQGRLADATNLFEKLLGLANDVGLLSEEYDTVSKRLTGNFPQAFSHIALIRAAMRLVGCPQ